MNNAGTVLLTDRRHVGHRGGGRGRRDRHPERHARPDREDHDRRDAGQDVHGQGHRDRQQPDSGDAGATSASQATNFKVKVTLDGEIPDVRPGLHLHRRDHDRDAQERRLACRSRRRRCARWSSTRRATSSASRERRRRKRPRRRRSRPSELKPGPGAEGARGRVRRPATTRRVFTPVKTGIAGEKYFEVLSGAEGRRPGHHRAVQLGARAGRRRRGQDRSSAATPSDGHEEVAADEP